jgi:hypothetical protein
MSEIKDGGPAVEIPLVSGGCAYVSQVDAERVSQSAWRLGNNGYVYKVGARKKGMPCLLHRIVMEAPAGMDVHHDDEDKLNCQRWNLEVTEPGKHQEHHKHLVINRNKAGRIHELTANCKRCGTVFTKDPDHRGRQTCCSKLCAIHLAVATRKEKRNAAG